MYILGKDNESFGAPPHPILTIMRGVIPMDKRKIVRPLKKEITVNGIKHVYINGVLHATRPVITK
jgi:hypothetical protein